MVNCGNQQSPSWFPASKLDIVPYQLFKSKLNPEQVAAMIEHACREPKPNKHLILNEGLASIGVTENLPTVLVSEAVRWDGMDKLLMSDAEKGQYHDFPQHD